MSVNPTEFDPSGFEAATREVLIRLAILEALPEHLIQKGVICREEWDWRAEACRKEMERKFEAGDASPSPPEMG